MVLLSQIFHHAFILKLSVKAAKEDIYLKILLYMLLLAMGSDFSKIIQHKKKSYTMHTEHILTVIITYRGIGVFSVRSAERR